MLIEGVEHRLPGFRPNMQRQLVEVILGISDQVWPRPRQLQDLDQRANQVDQQNALQTD